VEKGGHRKQDQTGIGSSWTQRSSIKKEGSIPQSKKDLVGNPLKGKGTNSVSRPGQQNARGKKKNMKKRSRMSQALKLGKEGKKKFSYVYT